MDGVLVFSPTANNGTNINPATGQYVDLPNDIARTRALTLETWTTYRGGGAWQRIADFGNNAWGMEIKPDNKSTTGYFGNGFIFLGPDNSQGRLIGQVSVNSWGGPDTDYIVAPTGLQRNVENHVVFVHDPYNNVQALYVNGVERAREPAQFDPSVMSYVNYWLGRSQFYQDPFYNGTINEFRIYDHGLTAAEAAASFARGPNVIPEPAALGLLGAGALVFLRRRA